MTETEKLNILFTAMLEIKWMAKERFRNGTLGLFKEATNQEQLESMLFVLKNLRYLGSSDVVDAGAGASTKIRSTWNLEPDSTLIVGVAEGDRTCGSEAYVRAIETSLPASWAESIKTQFKSAFSKRNAKRNLVIVDDFVGTGGKIIDRIGRLRNNPKTEDYQIFFCGFAG